MTPLSARPLRKAAAPARQLAQTWTLTHAWRSAFRLSPPRHRKARARGHATPAAGPGQQGARHARHDVGAREPREPGNRPECWDADCVLSTSRRDGHKLLEWLSGVSVSDARGLHVCTLLHHVMFCLTESDDLKRLAGRSN
jgi:hypothetical protein